VYRTRVFTCVKERGRVCRTRGFPRVKKERKRV